MNDDKQPTETATSDDVEIGKATSKEHSDDADTIEIEAVDRSDRRDSDVAASVAPESASLFASMDSEVTRVQTVRPDPAILASLSKTPQKEDKEDVEPSSEEEVLEVEDVEPEQCESASVEEPSDEPLQLEASSESAELTGPDEQPSEPPPNPRSAEPTEEIDEKAVSWFATSPIVFVVAFAISIFFHIVFFAVITSDYFKVNDLDVQFEWMVDAGDLSGLGMESGGRWADVTVYESKKEEAAEEPDSEPEPESTPEPPKPKPEPAAKSAEKTVPSKPTPKPKASRKKSLETHFFRKMGDLQGCRTKVPPNFPTCAVTVLGTWCTPR